MGWNWECYFIVYDKARVTAFLLAVSLCSKTSGTSLCTLKTAYLIVHNSAEKVFFGFREFIAVYFNSVHPLPPMEGGLEFFEKKLANAPQRGQTSRANAKGCS